MNGVKIILNGDATRPALWALLAAAFAGLVCLSATAREKAPAPPGEKAPAAAGEKAPAPPATPPFTGALRPFLCGDYVKGRVCLVSAQGQVDWEYPAKSVADVWVLPNGNFLFTTGRGAKEVTRDKKEVWSYQSKAEVFACQRLANGNTLVGECGAARLVEVDKDGTVVKEIALTAKARGHGQFRMARALADGHYLVAHYGESLVREYDAAGKVLREIKAANVFGAVRLPNGHTLISCGDGHAEGHRVFEVDQDGKTVWQCLRTDLEGIDLKFMAGVQRLANGNTVMCNWLGHGNLGQGPHIIEVTPEKKIVWTYSDHAAMKTVTAVQMLDEKGDVTRGEILR